MDTIFQKKNLDEITKEAIKEVVSHCTLSGLTRHACLGSSGEDCILFTRQNTASRTSRDRQLSFRLHNSAVEMLLTDKNGNFIFYGKFDKSLGSEFIANEFFAIFKKLISFLKADLEPDFSVN